MNYEGCHSTGDDVITYAIPELSDLDPNRFACQAERKLMRAERALVKVEQFLKPSEHQADPESITDEERFMFRKIGLRMKAFLLLGMTFF